MRYNCYICSVICLNFPLHVVELKALVTVKLIYDVTVNVLPLLQEAAFRKVVQTTMVRDRQHGPVIELNRIQVSLSFYTLRRLLLRRGGLFLESNFWHIHLPALISLCFVLVSVGLSFQ